MPRDEFCYGGECVARCIRTIFLAWHQRGVIPCEVSIHLACRLFVVTRSPLLVRYSSSLEAMGTAKYVISSLVGWGSMRRLPLGLELFSRATTTHLLRTRHCDACHIALPPAQEKAEPSCQLSQSFFIDSFKTWKRRLKPKTSFHGIQTGKASRFTAPNCLWSKSWDDTLSSRHTTSRSR